MILLVASSLVLQSDILAPLAFILDQSVSWKVLLMLLMQQSLEAKLRALIACLILSL